MVYFIMITLDYRESDKKTTEFYTKNLFINEGFDFRQHAIILHARTIEKHLPQALTAQLGDHQ